MMFIFVCVFDRKYTFFWKFVPKIKIVEAEIQNLDQFEYVILDSNFQFFLVRKNS